MRMAMSFVSCFLSTVAKNTAMIHEEDKNHKVNVFYNISHTEIAYKK